MTQKGVDDMKKHRLYLALLFSLTLWASSFPGIKASLDGYSPFAVAALRFLIASLILAGVAPWFNVRRPRPQDLPLILALAFIGVACYHIALNYGELTATASAAAFITNLAPVFTALLAWLFLGEAMPWRGWMGVGVSLAGVVHRLGARWLLRDGNRHFRPAERSTVLELLLYPAETVVDVLYAAGSDLLCGLDGYCLSECASPARRGGDALKRAAHARR